MVRLFIVYVIIKATVTASRGGASGNVRAMAPFKILAHVRTGSVGSSNREDRHMSRCSFSDGDNDDEVRMRLGGDRGA